LSRRNKDKSNPNKNRKTVSFSEKDFLPTTRTEMDTLGWEQCDVILVSGDDIKRLDEPRLYWGISGGSVDSMVSNYTATKKFRNSDDYTPGGKNDKRPDRALSVYCNLIRQHFKGTVPLFDAKGDILIYGMGEIALEQLTSALANGDDYRDILGVCYISKDPVYEYTQLPSHQDCLDDKEKYIDLFNDFYDNNDPISANGLCQPVDTRFLIQNPPCDYLDEVEMDAQRLCKAMYVDHRRNINLLRKVREVEGVRKAFIASGVRYDLITADKKNGYSYLKEMVKHHISGQMKVAPEHTQQHVLELMGKPGKETLIDFKKMYDKLNKESGKNQFLTYYLIAAHPGCEKKDMHELKCFTTDELQMNHEQAQVFTPTPGTYSAVMYYTEMDPKTRKKIFVVKDNFATGFAS